jgi:hypothetical protein
MRAPLPVVSVIFASRAFFNTPRTVFGPASVCSPQFGDQQAHQRRLGLPKHSSKAQKQRIYIFGEKLFAFEKSLSIAEQY